MLVMIPINPIKVQQVLIKAGCIREAMRTYLRTEDHEERQGGDWFGWPDYWSMLTHHSGNLEKELPAFVAHVVSYEYKDRWINRGLHRRNALNVLRKVGLRPPTATEIFRIATIERSTPLKKRKLALTCSGHKHRRIMCPTPINPEFPEFYYFGKGSDGQGGLIHQLYNTINADDNLYFARHDRETGRMDGMLMQYQHPLLIGVEE